MLDGACHAQQSAICGSAPMLDVTFLSALLSDMPSIAVVFDLDWLDVSVFSDHREVATSSRQPLYQTKIASDYYAQALNL